MNEHDNDFNDQDFDSTGIQPVESGPLGAADFGNPGGYASGSSGGGRKINLGGLLIGAVVLVSAGALFTMRTVASIFARQIETAPEVEQAIDKWLDRNQGSDMDSMEIVRENEAEVMGVLGDDYTEFQVPLVNVQCNPFVIYGEGEAADVPVEIDTGTRAEREFAEKQGVREGRMQAAAQSLSLTSIMMSDPPLANINGRIVRPGEKIVIEDADKDIEFEVRSIEMDVVRLFTQDLRYAISFEAEVRVNRD